MAHKITYNEKLHIIETKGEGIITQSEMKEIFSQILQIAKEKDAALFLSNYLGAKISISVAEYYELPKLFEDTASALGLNARNLKRALVVDKSVHNTDFLETVSFNRGQQLKIFQHVDKAMEWLLPIHQTVTSSE